LAKSFSAGVFWKGFLPFLMLTIMVMLGLYLIFVKKLHFMLTSVFIFFIFIIIGIYSRSIYPSLPLWMGGGKPQVAQIVVDSSLGHLMPFPRQRGQYSAVNAEVIFEDDNSIVFGYRINFVNIKEKDSSGFILKTVQIHKSDIRLLDYSKIPAIFKEEKVGTIGSKVIDSIKMHEK
jgi:hypothetical protein